MADLPRLLDDPGLSPDARAILRSSDADGPPASSRARAARALGISAAVIVTGEATAAATATAATATAWWTAPLIVLSIVGVAGGGWWLARGGSSATSTTTAISATHDPIATAPTTTAPIATAPITAATIATAPTTIATAPTTIATAPTTIATAPTTIAPPAPRPARPHAPSSPVTTATAAAAITTTTTPAPIADDPPAATIETAPDSAPPAHAAGTIAVVDARRLAAEVALLDDARARLRAGDADAALTALARHDREFPGGSLTAEADVLRIEAYLARGDRDRATTLARAFLTRFPSSPLAPRVRTLVPAATTQE